MSLPVPTSPVQALPFEQPQSQPQSQSGALPFEQDSTITISGIDTAVKDSFAGAITPQMKPKQSGFWFDQQSDGSTDMVVDTELENGAVKHDRFKDVEKSDDVHALASFYKWRDSEAQPVTGRGMQSDAYYIDLAYHKILARSSTATKVGSEMFNVLNSISLGGLKAALDKWAPGAEHAPLARLAEASNVRDEYTPITQDDWKNRVRRVMEGETEAAASSVPFIYGGAAVSATGIGKSVGLGIAKKFPTLARAGASALKLGKVAEKEAPVILGHAFDSALTFGGLDAYSEMVNTGQINPKKLVAAVVTGGYFPTFSQMVSKVYEIPARREALAQALKGIIGVSAVTTPQVIVDTAATIQDEKKVDFLTALGMAARKFGQDPMPLIENAFSMSIFAASGAFDRFTKSTQTNMEIASILEQAQNGHLDQTQVDKLTKFVQQNDVRKAQSPAPSTDVSTDFGGVKVGDKLVNKPGNTFEVLGFDRGRLIAKSLKTGSEAQITKETFKGAEFRKAEEVQTPPEPPNIPISKGVENEGGISKEGTPEINPPPISSEEPTPSTKGSEVVPGENLPKVNNEPPVSPKVEGEKGRTSQEILGSLSDNAKTGITEATRGLSELFGGESLKSFPGGIDESTFNKALPHFEKAWDSLKSAGKDFNDLVSVMVSQFGEKIRPYIERFIATRTSKVPKFDGSTAAAVFGREHPELIPEMNQLAKQYEDEFNRLKDEKNIDGALQASVQSQLYKEAVEYASDPSLKTPFEKDNNLPAGSDKAGKRITQDEIDSIFRSQGRPKVGSDEYADWFNKLTDAQKEAEVNRRNAEDEMANQPKPEEPFQQPQEQKVVEPDTPEVTSLKSSSEIIGDIRSAVDKARGGLSKEKGIDVEVGIPTTTGTESLENLTKTLERGLVDAKEKLAKAEAANRNPKIIEYLKGEVSKAESAISQMQPSGLKSPAEEAARPFLDQLNASIHDNFSGLPARLGNFTESNLQAFYLAEAGLSHSEIGRLIGMDRASVTNKINRLWGFITKPLEKLKLHEVATRKKLLDLMYQLHPDYAEFLKSVRELGKVDKNVPDEQYIKQLFDEASNQRGPNDLNESDSIEEAVGAALPTSVGMSPNAAEIQRLQSLPPVIERNIPGFVEKTKTDLAKIPDALKSLLNSSIDLGKKFRDMLTKPPDWSGGIGNNKRIFGEYLANLTKIDRESLLMSAELRRVVPDEKVLEGMTKYIRTGGDTDKLRRLVDSATWQTTLDPKLRDKAITKYQAALNLTPDQITIANEIGRYFDAKLKEGIAADVIGSGVEDYVTRLWNKPNVATQRLLSDLGNKKLQQNFYAARKRIFDADFEGESLGYEPLTDNLADLVGIYAYSFGKSVASRAYVRALLDQGMIASDGRPLAAVTGGSNLKNIEPGEEVNPTLIWPNAKAENVADYQHPNNSAFKKWKWVGSDESGKPNLIQGDIVVHPEIFKQVNNAFSSSEWMKYTPIKWLTDFQGSAKGLKFSLSAFHYVQEGTHALGHTVNPIANLVKIDMDNPVHYALVSHSLMLNDRSALTQFMEGLAGTGWAYKVPVLGRGLIQPMTEHLFGEYIPRLKMTTALHILARNIDRYESQIQSGKLSYDQVLELSASQANAAYGMLNYKWMGRNPTFQHFLRLALIAPDFLESRLRFAGQAIKPYGREQLRAIAILSGEIYVVGRILNKVLDDDYHLGDPFTVYYGDRKYSIRSVPGDIWNLATDPSKFASSRLAPFVQAISEISTGKDWRGVQANFPQQVRDLALRWFPVALTPQEGMKFYDGAWNAIGIHKTRYSFDAEVKRLASDFNKSLGKPIAKYPVEGKYSGLKQALEDQDMTGALNEYEKLLELSTRSEIDRGFEQSVNRPFTGSSADDQLFIKTLTESEKEKLQKAKDEHKDVMRLFHQTVAKHLSLGKPTQPTLKSLRKAEILKNNQ